jgi:alkylhydroperoxidase family enzyme
MARLRYLEGREAGVLAGVIQTMARSVLGRPLNPIKIYARSRRALLASFIPNMIFGSGRWVIGAPLAQMVRLRAAARNGCPF